MATYDDIYGKPVAKQPVGRERGTLAAQTDADGSGGQDSGRLSVGKEKGVASARETAVSTAPPASAVSSQQAMSVQGVKEVSMPKMGYTQLYERMSPYKPLTPDQEEKERKKQKRDRIFAAIGDGISALSNLYFTTKGSPNAFDPSKSMTATTKARWDKLQAEREAKRKQYLDGYMRAKAADDAAADKERVWKYRQERDKKDDDRADAAAKLKDELGDLDKRLRGHQITAAEYKAKQEEIKAGYAERQQKADLAVKGSVESRNNKQGQSAIIRANKAGSGSGGGRGSGVAEFIAYDSDGNERKFKTAKAAEQYARQQGTWQVDQATTTTTSGNGRRTKTTTQTKPNGGHSYKPKPAPKPEAQGTGAKPSGKSYSNTKKLGL